MWRRVTEVEDAYASSCMTAGVRCNSSVRFQAATTGGKGTEQSERQDENEAENTSLLPTEARRSVCSKGKDETQLMFETYNSSGWRSLKKRLTTTQAHLLFAQEHGILKEASAETEESCLAIGWRAIIFPAKGAAGNAGGADSCGVATFARQHRTEEIASHEDCA